MYRTTHAATQSECTLCTMAEHCYSKTLTQKGQGNAICSNVIDYGMRVPVHEATPAQSCSIGALALRHQDLHVHAGLRVQWNASVNKPKRASPSRVAVRQRQVTLSSRLRSTATYTQLELTFSSAETNVKHSTIATRTCERVAAPLKLIYLS